MPKSVAQRRREQTRPGRGPHQGEFGEIDLHRAGTGAGADHEIELKILHRRIEDFLDRGVQPVDFVDEQHVAVFERGQLRGEIAAFGDHRAGGRAEIHPQFARDNLRQRRLAEAGRADEQHMVERIAPRLGGLDKDLEIFARHLLAGEIGKRQRPQRGVMILGGGFGRDQAAGFGHGRLTVSRIGSLSRRWPRAGRGKVHAVFTRISLTWLRRLFRPAAEVRDRATPALRLQRFADVAPVQDQPMMRVKLIGRRDDPLEPVLDGAHSLAGRQRNAVGDAEDMGIDGDRRLAESDVEHDIGGLAADAGQGFERLAGLRHLACELRDKGLRQADDILGLGAVEPDRLDVVADRVFAQREHFLRAVGLGEERGRGFVDPGIGRLRRKDDGDEQGEGIVIAEFAVGMRIGHGEAAENLFDLGGRQRFRPAPGALARRRFGGGRAAPAGRSRDGFRFSSGDGRHLEVIKFLERLEKSAPQ